MVSRELTRVFGMVSPELCLLPGTLLGSKSVQGSCNNTLNASWPFHGRIGHTELGKVLINEFREMIEITGTKLIARVHQRVEVLEVVVVVPPHLTLEPGQETGALVFVVIAEDMSQFVDEDIHHCAFRNVEIPTYPFAPRRFLNINRKMVTGGDFNQTKANEYDGIQDQVPTEQEGPGVAPGGDGLTQAVFQVELAPPGNALFETDRSP